MRGLGKGHGFFFLKLGHFVVCAVCRADFREFLSLFV
jgi:hypothetical protein